jgi:hypothetical protein
MKPRVEFRVIWEIEIEADTPTEAAFEARAIQLTPDMSATVFDVWARVAGKMHRIDVEEEDERLDRNELVVVRTGLRLHQCKTDVPASIQDLGDAGDAGQTKQPPNGCRGSGVKPD